MGMIMNDHVSEIQIKIQAFSFKINLKMFA